MIAGLLIGLVVGAVGAWLLLRSKNAELSARFGALAADALHRNNETFLDLASGKLDLLQNEATHELEQRKKEVEHLVEPIRESLQKVDGTLQQLEVARTGAYSALSTQVRQLAESQSQLRSETGNLVSALRDRPNVRGRWGEIQLRRVVEMAGMLEHCDFETQAHVSTEDGRLRPDLIVKLPGSKTVVVDSKFAGQAYLESLGARDDEERVQKLRDHARQVRDHIAKLSGKSYWSQFASAPEFVVLFIPGETFLSAALEQDPSLIEEGVNQQVILATPTTLIALLRAVAYGWRQETIAESAKTISDLGRELYGRLATLTEHFAKVGRGLETAVRSYNETVGSLETRVLPSARKFRDHGISPASELAELPAVERTVRPVTAPELAPGEDTTADAA
ncbi:MAG TPA: DNA recombination protein RmuC [Gaiellaceae bacterium]|jgi:DNA recombination protein RmuC|nr:DNA recombination protein RmuC [Gaiellaceae bacterium]